ncbi:MAG: tetratricopeptide repeat protein [Planctomycetota bacterium]
MNRIARTMTAGFLSLALAASAGAAVSVAQPDAPTMQQGQQLMQSGDLAGAAEIFEQLTKADPNDGTAWLLYGFAVHGLGDYDKAIEIHKKAAETNIGQMKGVALYNVACVHALQNDKDKAFTALEVAFNGGFANAQQLAADTDMDNLREDDRFERFVTWAETGEDPDFEPASLGGMHFWVGEWTVYGRDRRRVGSNSITSQSDGKVVIESWTGRGGDSGVSMNYPDPGRQSTWHQVWVGSTGDELRTSGTPTEDGVVFNGTHRLPDGRELEHRMIFEVVRDGCVRQHITQRPVGSGSWNVVFDALYVPEKNALQAWWPNELPSTPTLGG